MVLMGQAEESGSIKIKKKKKVAFYFIDFFESITLLKTTCTKKQINTTYYLLYIKNEYNFTQKKWVIVFLLYIFGTMKSNEKKNCR